MMHNRMTCPAERLEVVQCIVARMAVAPTSGAAAIQMMDGKIVPRSAPLAPEAITFQSLLSVPAEVKVITCCAEIAVKTLLRHPRHAQAYDCQTSGRGAFRAPSFWAAVVNELFPAILARICRSNDTRSGISPAFFQSITIEPGANDRSALWACLLTSACWLIGSAAFLADAFAVAIAGLSVCFERAWHTSFCVRAVFHHLIAATRTDDGSVQDRVVARQHYSGGRWKLSSFITSWIPTTAAVCHTRCRYMQDSCTIPGLARHGLLCIARWIVAGRVHSVEYWWSECAHHRRGGGGRWRGQHHCSAIHRLWLSQYDNAAGRKHGERLSRPIP